LQTAIRALRRQVAGDVEPDLIEVRVEARQVQGQLLEEQVKDAAAAAQRRKVCCGVGAGG
jgi:hypothetical protein